MPRSQQNAIKWALGALRQYRRLCESYDSWFAHHSVVARDESTWTLEARQLSGALQDAYLVDAHLFLVAAGQLVKTLNELEREDLLALIPDEHVTHARNAMEHDDERGLYRRDYQGYGWTIGPGPGGTGPYDVYGLRLEPLVDGLKEIAEQLGPTTIST